MLRDDEDPLFGWVRVRPDVVVPSPAYQPPAVARLPVDGLLEGATMTAMQIFVGLDVQRDFADMDLTQFFVKMIISRMTDYALAAFLNVYVLVFGNGVGFSVVEQKVGGHVHALTMSVPPFVIFLYSRVSSLSYHPTHGHVPMPSFRKVTPEEWPTARKPLVVKLQNFLNSYPEMSGVRFALMILCF